MNNMRLSGHGAYRNEYHVVWITKYRRTFLDSRAGQYLAELMPEVVNALPGCEIVQCNIQPEHVHMALIIPPKYAVSKVVGQIKSKTSGELRRRFRSVRNTYPAGKSIWSPGFFVRTVGVGEDEILKYIRQQVGDVK
jgi:putative transposase